MDYNFDELIEAARNDGCSDVHITVGTAMACRRYGSLDIIEDVPSAVQSQNLILEKLTDEQKRQFSEEQMVESYLELLDKLNGIFAQRIKTFLPKGGC